MQTLAEKINPIVWVEKYRPKTVDDCILPKSIKKDFKAFVSSRDFPNLLLCGSAGTGKTSLARALCEQLEYDYILINASDERNIDVVRSRIKSFAGTVSLAGNNKAIILDEADGLSPIAQGALRAAIEEFKSTKFILTCNYKNKLIEPIHSRLAVIEFNNNPQDASSVKIEFLKRVFEILEKEDVKFDKAVVGAVIKKYYPDNRRVLNELQRYSRSGEIDTGLLATLENTNINTLVEYIKSRDFGKCRQWVEDNSELDTGTLYRSLYDTLYNEVKPECVCDLVEIVGKYQVDAAFAADIGINTQACIANIMSIVEFK